MAYLIYISHKFKPHVGKYTNPMDPMGHDFRIFTSRQVCAPKNRGEVILLMDVDGRNPAPVIVYFIIFPGFIHPS